MCLIICLEKLSQGSLFYTMYYLTKHSSFKEKINKNFAIYAKEVFQNSEKNVKIENNEFINKKFSEKYAINIPNGYGIMCYYGVSDIIKPDKEKALINFKKSYQLSKEKEYIFQKRINYFYIYKCRKYLYKNNKITLRKLKKTKEKLFTLFEECNLDNLSVLELYNYYKLYKIEIQGNNQNKLISILKKGKNEKIVHHFRDIVYIEKSKIALEKEYSNASSINYDKKFFKMKNLVKMILNYILKLWKVNNMY